jgi:ABC-type phosphate transport system substrate-binding protein
MSMKFKPVLATGVVAAGVLVAGAAQALGTPVTLYGGGATLPAIAYIGTGFYNNSDPTHSTRLSLSNSTGAAGSLFAAFTSKTTGKPIVSYCQTGSGTGRKVLNGTNAANGTCGDFSGTPTGFAAPGDMSFAASDAPLSSAEYTTFINNKGSTKVEPFQFPVIAGAVAMIYNNANVAAQLALTDAQVCGIAKGTISNWNQLNASFASKPIVFIYRSDGSGTSFSFTNHLSAVCTGQGFQTTSTFNVGNTPPAGSVAASGNPGVVTAIAAQDGAIGYGEVADAKLRNPDLKWATVNGKDPVGDLVAPKTTKLTDVALGTNDANGRPTTVALAPTKKGCVIVADPNTYANPTGSYPIVAVSYLMGYQKGNGTNYSKIRSLLKAPYTAADQKATTTVGTGTGFSFLASTDGPTTTVRNACITK